jgi:hypothetical protein
LLVHALAGSALIGCGAAATGCGQSGVTPPPSVQVSLTAPTDGATISTRNLLVFGTVDPPSAAVTVAGIRVRVANGVFRHWMSLGWGARLIRLEATAPGYSPTGIRVAVRNEALRVTAVGQRRTHGRGGPAANSSAPFVARANQACARPHAADLGIAWSEASKLTSADSRVQPVQQLITNGEQLAAQLRRIRVPLAQAPAYSAFVASYQAAIDGVQGILADAQAHQARKLESDVSGLALTFRTAAQSGDALGLHACTNDRSAS